jgi:hypothetical protein
LRILSLFTKSFFYHCLRVVGVLGVFMELCALILFLLK